MHDVAKKIYGDWVDLFNNSTEYESDDYSKPSKEVSNIKANLLHTKEEDLVSS